ncbi:MAG: hypothetical protein K6U80_13945 [Firmicutes bacterium]|nr:hypothetical protein [Bacillota bacterium]
MKRLNCKVFLLITFSLLLILFFGGSTFALVQDYGDIGFTSTIDDINQQFSTELFLNNIIQINYDNFLGYFSCKATYTNNEDNFFDFNKAFISYQNEFCKIEIGKDRIVNGVGYVWSPADILNPKKSLLYRNREQQNEEMGVPLIAASLFGTKNDFSYEIRNITMIEEGEDISEGKNVISSKFNWPSFEMLLLTGFQNDKENIYAGYIRTPIPGYDICTLYLEFCNQNSHDWKQLIGIQFNPNFIFLADSAVQFQIEYFNNSSGFNSIKDFFKYRPGEVPILAEVLKNYAYIGALYISPSLSFSLGVISNIDEDRSGMGNYLFTYNLSELSKINLGGYFSFGEADKEFPLLLNKNYEIYLSYSLSFSVN